MVGIGSAEMDVRISDLVCLGKWSPSGNVRKMIAFLDVGCAKYPLMSNGGEVAQLDKSGSGVGE